MKYLQSKSVFEHLRSFNESFDESNIDDIVKNIEDILLPISDMGYEINVDEDLDGSFIDNVKQIVISVIGLESRYLLKVTDEVKDEFIRMKEYLESEGFNSIKAIYISSHNYMGSGRVDFNKFITMKDVELTKLTFVVFP